MTIPQAIPDIDPPISLQIQQAIGGRSTGVVRFALILSSYGWQQLVTEQKLTPYQFQADPTGKTYSGFDSCLVAIEGDDPFRLIPIEQYILSKKASRIVDYLNTPKDW